MICNFAQATRAFRFLRQPSRPKPLRPVAKPITQGFGAL